jgi:hypothetical protein
MGDVILRKESTSELYKKAEITSGPIDSCSTPYDPLQIGSSFQIADFEIKITYIGAFTGNDINYEWAVKGEPKITRLTDLSPTIKSYYDDNRPVNAPVMSNELNAEIQTLLIEDAFTKEEQIKNKIRNYYSESITLAARSQEGANEIIKFFAAKEKMSYTKRTWTTITISGKIMIRPQIVTAAIKEDSAKMTYKSGSGIIRKTCATAQILLSEDLDNYFFRLNNLIDSTEDLDMTPYTNYNTFGFLTLNALELDAPNIYAQMDYLRSRQTSLVEEASREMRTQERYSKWIREWSRNQSTTITNQGDGFFKFSLGSGPGVFNIGVIIPFGEGGLYFQDTRIIGGVDINRLTAEIGYWQQYAARVREYQNNYSIAVANYLAGLKYKIPPETALTDLTITPIESFGTILPNHPEIFQSPQVEGFGGRDLIPLTPTPDLSPFFPGQIPPFQFINIFELPPLTLNNSINGFFKV